MLKPGDKFKLANNDVEVHSINEDADKIYLLIFDGTGLSQLHTDGFGLKWVLEGFETGVNIMSGQTQWT